MEQISLAADAKLAAGRVRSVFIHPNDPEKIIKVLHDKELGATGVKGLMRRLAPLSRYRHLVRENSVCFRASLLAYERRDPPPVALQYGLVETNLGLGTVSERIRQPGEVLGRTLGEIQMAPDLADHLGALNDFAARLFSWGIRANDFNLANIVFGVRAGIPQFVLVDGIGDSNFVPVRTLSDRMNMRSLNKRLSRASSFLSWNKAERCFVLK